jgi:hypothetical protein
MEKHTKFILCLAIIPIFCILQQEAFAYRCDTPNEWMVGNNSSRHFFPGTTWPGGVVKYELHSSLSQQDRVYIGYAFGDYHSKTCIRFQQRSPGELNYVSLESISNPNVCGVAEYCMKGGYQYARFGTYGGGSACHNPDIMIHELGHTLCLGHEMTRPDRDQYVHFSGCSSSAIPQKDSNYRQSGLLYDYASQMHYQCGFCDGGYPLMGGVGNRQCGIEITKGLSVLDAEKINLLYNCKGCFGYRFRPVNALTDSDKRDMFPFGYNVAGNKLYACRTYHNGDIIPGTYDGQTCYVAHNGLEHQYRGAAGVEVFTLPGSAGGNSGNGGIYSWVQMNGNTPIPANAIAGGREKDGVTTYIASCILDYGGKKSRVVGKLIASIPQRAYMPFYGKEVQINKENCFLKL